MNKEVNFETAKLLKEKKFDEPCTYYYELEYAHLYPENTIHTWDPRFKTKFKNSYQWEKAAAPTIAEVVIWLYEKHGIWVYTKPVLDEDGEWIFKGYVKPLNDFKAKEYQTKLLKEPTGSYEAAITYTLENLIQGGNND